MTSTLESQTALTPQERVDAWLGDFEAALAARDIDRAVAKFATDSFWRDLVAFTWNIKTVEGRDQIAGMLGERLADTDPSGFRTREPAVADGDVTSAFIEFETAVGRGTGHLRLKGDQAWTLLTTLQELKGHEEPKGATRVLGAVHGSDPDPRSWAEKRAEEDATLGRTVAAVRAGHRRRPGRHRAGCAAAPARRAGDRRRQARTTRRPVAQALQVAVPARPGLVRPPAVHAVPGQLAGVRAEGQDRRLARVLHPGHGGAVLVEDGHACRRRSTPKRVGGPSRWTATARS